MDFKWSYFVDGIIFVYGKFVMWFELYFWVIIDFVRYSIIKNVIIFNCVDDNGKKCIF